MGQAVLPTPVIGMAGVIDDVQRRATQWFSRPGDRVALLGPEAVSLGGSEYLWTAHGRVAGRLAPLDLGMERAVQEACRAAIGAGLLRSAHDCSEGGLAVALAEACISGAVPVGLLADLGADDRPLAEILFGEGPSRIIVSMPGESEQHWGRLMGEFAVPWRWLGRVSTGRLVIRRGSAVAIDLDAERCATAWREGFARYVS